MKTISAHVTGFYHTSFHAYTTEVSLNGHRWRLGLRYSKFRGFFDQLVMQDKEFAIKFPPKGTLFFTPKPEERQEQLELFLQQVLAYYAARSFPIEIENLLCDLLKVPNHLRSYERDDDDTSTSTESGQDEPMNESMMVGKKEDEHVETNVAKTVEQVVANEQITTDPIALTEKTLVQNELPSPLAPAEEGACATLNSVLPASPVVSVLHAKERIEEAHDEISASSEDTQMAHEEFEGPSFDVVCAAEQTEQALDETPVSEEDTEVAHGQPASVSSDVTEETHNDTAASIEETDGHRQPAGPLADVLDSVEQTKKTHSDATMPIEYTEVVHTMPKDDIVASAQLVQKVTALSATLVANAEKERMLVGIQEPDPEIVSSAKLPVDTFSDKKSTVSNFETDESLCLERMGLTPRGRLSSWIATYVPKPLLEFLRHRCMKKTSLFVLSVALLRQFTMTKIEARVTGFKYTTFYTYTTEVKVNVRNWTLGIRYSTFHRFYTHLLMLEKHFKVNFPPKGTLFSSPAPEERQELLNEFLTSTLYYFDIRRCPKRMEALIAQLLEIPQHLQVKEVEDERTASEGSSDEDEKHPTQAHDETRRAPRASVWEEDRNTVHKDMAQATRSSSSIVSVVKTLQNVSRVLKDILEPIASIGSDPGKAPALKIKQDAQATCTLDGKEKSVHGADLSSAKPSPEGALVAEKKETESESLPLHSFRRMSSCGLSLSEIEELKVTNARQKEEADANIRAKARDEVKAQALAAELFYAEQERNRRLMPYRYPVFFQNFHCDVGISRYALLARQERE
ncbi:hypothetical protein PsorP6_013513 [Peronosclerospora sorghi]|uniref:Uncharacterized protein n=1 Tax=Peronosclerospora sorghi TaxID=230839 RepID=A0ACC0VJ56_9STRA|nr:hypothetical protein PsorP6_013513 [Peronosclerospora sorghi]